MLPSTDLKASAPRTIAFSVLNSPDHPSRYRRFASPLAGTDARPAEKRGSVTPSFRGTCTPYLPPVRLAHQIQAIENYKDSLRTKNALGGSLLRPRFARRSPRHSEFPSGRRRTSSGGSVEPGDGFGEHHCRHERRQSCLRLRRWCGQFFVYNRPHSRQSLLHSNAVAAPTAGFASVDPSIAFQEILVLLYALRRLNLTPHSPEGEGAPSVRLSYLLVR